MAPKKAAPPIRKGSRTRKAQVAIGKSASPAPETRPTRATRARSRAAVTAEPASPPPAPKVSRNKRKADDGIEAPTPKKTRDRRKESTSKPQPAPSTAAQKSKQPAKQRKTIVKKPAPMSKKPSASPSSSGAHPPTTMSDPDAKYLTPDGHRLWLMKAEPDSRIVKGQDVKFSIDDLAVCLSPESWEGVRNREAKNSMRRMQKGDKAFFYHSNTKTPGIAGTMTIVEDATPDESAFDEEHPYFDKMSRRENPTWFCPKVVLDRKFPALVSLDEMKAYKDGELKDFEALNRTRLSISRVTPAEWEFIHSLMRAAATASDNPPETDSPERAMSELEEITKAEVEELPEVSNGDVAVQQAAFDRLMKPINEISASALLEPASYLAREEVEGDFTFTAGGVDKGAS